MDNEVGDAEYKLSHQMNFGNTNYIEGCKTNQNNDMEILTYNPKEIEEYSNDEVEAFTIAYDIKEKIENKYLVVDKDTSTLRECKYSDFAIIMDRGTSFDLYKKIFEYVGVHILQIKNEKLTLGDDLLVLKNLINLIVKKKIFPKKIKVVNSFLYLDELHYKFSTNGWLCFDYYIENAKFDYEIEIIEW
jgi:ATP-dependent exoDNAse (exonuclease V) beta subunit